MMPLYEGIALIQERQAVVLDLGTEYTKFGFTGEAAPRCFIRSEFWSAPDRGFKKVHDYKTPEELYENLVHMLQLLYFRHVLVNPKERKVVVVESLLTTTLFRETLAKVLFLHYEVSGAVWADSGRLSTLTLGVPTALVVDIGASGFEITAVVHGTPIIRAHQSQPIGSKAMREDLRKRLDEDNNCTLNLPDHVLEDILITCCYVAPHNSPPARPVTRGRIRVGADTRAAGGEMLFERDRDRVSLGDCVLTAILLSPIDARRPLAHNVLVVGGLASLPGLKKRLADELNVLITEEPYCHGACSRPKYHSPPCPVSVTAWLGGAVLAGDTLTTRALARDVFVRARRLTDWTDVGAA